jgi:hypothetical protein
MTALVLALIPLAIAFNITQSLPTFLASAQEDSPTESSSEEPSPPTSDFDVDKLDYLRAYDQYRLDHLSYVAAKSTYLQYQTQITKSQALQATQRMLNSRQDVLIKYLTALKSRVIASPGLSSSEVESLIIDLDNELQWLRETAQLFNDADDLKDLTNLSKKVESEHQKIERIAYHSLGKILVAKERVFHQSVVDLHKLTNDQIIRARTEGAIKTEIMERWLLDASDKIELSEIKESEALVKLDEIRDRDKHPNKHKKFVTYQLLVDETNQYLKEATQLMLETVKQMKHAN